MIRVPNVLAIARKDLLDATRQGRIVVILLTPLLLAVFYNFSFPEGRRPEVKLAHVSPDGPALVERLRDRLSATIDLKIDAAGDADAARAAIVDRRADMALVLPAGLEAAMRSPGPPVVRVMSESTSTARELVIGQFSAMLREMAGQPPLPVTIRSETVERPGSEPVLIVQLGPRVYFVLAALVMVVSMIAIIVVPMILAEESEKRTLDALLMIGSIGDVMAAKALVGLVFIVMGIALVLGLTRIPVRDAVPLAVGLGGLAVGLVGFGLVLGVVFRNAMQVSTWSGFLLLPIMGPAFTVGLPLPAPLETALRAIPTAQAVRLVANAFAARPMYTDTGVQVAVLTAWAILAYALLGWRLSRREA